MNIVIPDLIDLPAETRQKLHDIGAKVYENTPGEPELIERIRDAEIITANWVDIPARVIDACPNLKYIIASAVGYDYIDIRHAASKGIKALNCPTYHAHAVAEHALALMLSVARKIPQAVASVQGGEWAIKEPLQGTELRGKKLGIVGYGRVGKEIAKMTEAIGVQSMFANSKTSGPELDALLSESNIICLCLPLTDASEHLLDARRLKLLQRNSIIINVGRGATIDQNTLYEMLKNGDLAGAGLDVFEDEPLSGSVPESIIQLADLPNVVATPHIGYNTVETNARLGEELTANIQSCLAGQPQNVVN